MVAGPQRIHRTPCGACLVLAVGTKESSAARALLVLLLADTPLRALVHRLLQLIDAVDLLTVLSIIRLLTCALLFDALPTKSMKHSWCHHPSGRLGCEILSSFLAKQTK